VNNTGTKYVRIMKQNCILKRKKTESIYCVKNIQYVYLLNKYINCNFGGWRCGTSTIVDIRRLKVKLSSKFISVFNQLDAQNLFHNKFYFMPLHVSSTCAHHQEVKIVLHSLWYHHTYRWPSRARYQRLCNAILTS